MKVSEEIHEALRFIGYKGESYDQIIRRVLEHFSVTWGLIPGIRYCEADPGAYKELVNMAPDSEEEKGK